jgi:hypothetical protein
MEDFLDKFKRMGSTPICSADELCVHALLAGYHQPNFDKEKIIDMFISDAYSGHLGLLYEDEIIMSLKMIKNIVDSAKDKGINI